MIDGRIASLPMYTVPSHAVAQRFWRGIARHLQARGLAGVPSSLVETLGGADDEALLAHWRDRRLLLSQSCGQPLVRHLRNAGVQVVGAFRYAAPGCEGGRYRSLLVCREADAGKTLASFRGRTAAINSHGSHSGCQALRAAVATQGRAALFDETDGGPVSSRPFFSSVVVSGSHANSLQALRDGHADIAAIDAVSHALFKRHHPAWLQTLRVVGATPCAPGLPLITAATTLLHELDSLRAALHAAVHDPALAAERQALLIDGFEAWPSAVYDEMASTAPGDMAAACWP